MTAGTHKFYVNSGKEPLSVSRFNSPCWRSCRYAYSEQHHITVERTAGYFRWNFGGTILYFNWFCTVQAGRKLMKVSSYAGINIQFFFRFVPFSRGSVEELVHWILTTPIV